MQIWYYALDGKEIGPLTQADLANLFAKGRLARTTLVWTEGMEDWAPAKEFVCFFPSEASHPTDTASHADAAPHAKTKAKKNFHQETPPRASRRRKDFSSEKPLYGPTRPWPRYWARTFDVTLFLFLLGFLWPQGTMLSLNLADASSSALAGMRTLLLYAFVEPLWLMGWGTTPGKALTGVHLTKRDGSSISYGEGLRRSMQVFVRGFGCGIPIVSMVAHFIAFQQVSDKKEATWDRDGGFLVRQENLGCGYACILGVLFLFMAVFLTPLTP